MENACTFSPCRRSRYSLIHQMRPGGRRLVWIGLNPSTADEQQLDPTLRRIRAFSLVWGFDEFVMLNLFAYRTKDPALMKAQADPVGPRNDATLLKHARAAERVIAAWSRDGAHQGRAGHVQKLLAGRLECLRRNADQSPAHPLYLPGTLRPIPFG